jgi:hypothetical protein
MEDCSHVEIFMTCYVAAATSAMALYSFSTVYSETQVFSFKKAIAYSFYFGVLGLLTSMLGFDWLGGKPKWYRVVGVSGGVGIGVLKAEKLIELLAGLFKKPL